MIKIGEFARLSQVSIVTLRHYDELGLLKPVTIDKFTGYRYYSVSQLPRLNRILALKDLGFSLAQIEDVLNGGVSIEELRGMLKMKMAEVEQQVADEQARLARIAARLRQIELEDNMPNYDVVLKTVPVTLVASNTVTIPTNDQVPEYLDKAYMAVYTHIGKEGGKKAAPHFAIWHQPAEILANEIAEAAVPLEKPIPSTDDVKVYELPETQVVSAVHHGDFDGFQQLHKVLLKWVEDNGYRTLGGYREIYIKFDPENMSDTATEVQYPVEKA